MQKLKSKKNPRNYVVLKSDQGNTYKCKQCEKPFPNISYFNNHFVKLHPENCLKCDKCTKLFVTSFKLRIHSGTCKINYEIISSTGDGENIYQCKECKKTFSKKPTFLNHFIMKHKENNFKCEKCGKLFAYKSIMETHMKKCDGKLRNRTEADSHEKHYQIYNLTRFFVESELQY